MDIKLNLYNRKTVEGWIDDANHKEGEVIFMLSRGIHRPHDIHLHWDSNRGLGSLIEHVESMLNALKQSQKENNSSGHLSIHKS